MATVQVTTWKTCTTCWHEKPISEFRRRWRGKEDRHTQCNSCKKEASRARTAKNRDKTIHKFAQEINNRARRGGPMAPVVDAMVKRFGGCEGVANAWYTAFQNAADAGKHYLTLRACSAIVNLLQARETCGDGFDGMSLEELKELRFQHFVKAILDSPDVAACALKHLGYQVIPPGGAETGGSG